MQKLIAGALAAAPLATSASHRWDGYRWNECYSDDYGYDPGYAATDPAAALFGAALGFATGQH